VFVELVYHDLDSAQKSRYVRMIGEEPGLTVKEVLENELAFPAALATSESRYIITLPHKLLNTHSVLVMEVSKYLPV
jgi:hypothetical protein